MNQHYAAQRAQEIYDELSTKNVTPERVKQLSAELDDLNVASKTLRAAQGWAGSADPYPDGNPDRGTGTPAGQMPWQLPEGEGSNIAQLKHHAPSPLDMTSEQLQDLFAAGKNSMSFATTVGQGAVHNKTLGAAGMEIHTKAAVSEGAPGTLIPPILLPQAFTLRLEPTRIAEYLPAIAAEGQSVSWLQHQSN